jgi:aspartate racemase
MKDILDFIEREAYEQLTWYLYRCVQNLKKAGADFAIIASNTPHIVFDKLSRMSPIPLISIIDVTIDEITRCGYKNVLLTGTAFTMKNSFYKDSLESHGIKCTVPDNAEIDAIHNIIFQELENGIVNEQKKADFIAVCEKYAARGAEAVILGCTELPLLLKDGDVSIPVINTMELHIEETVRKLYGYI